VFRLRRFCCAFALLGSFLIVSATDRHRDDWRTYKPILKSQVTQLDLSTAQSLLTHFCADLSDTGDFGPVCKTQHLTPEFSDIGDEQFHPESVIFGRFLDSSSDDAAISGWSLEGHGDRWGGTLLLRREGAEWKPVWYKSGVITEYCEKAERPDGREVLLCELEDGGWGHQYHELNAIDLRQASKLTPPILSVDSFESNGCEGQKQTMAALEWHIPRRSFSVLVRTPEWHRTPGGYCGGELPNRPKPSVRMNFEVTNDGVRPR